MELDPALQILKINKTNLKNNKKVNVGLYRTILIYSKVLIIPFVQLYG
jgi:hypothetical protein